MTEIQPPINQPQHNVPEYSVSEVAGAVKRMVEERFGRVRVRGEISGWKVASSGHVYFRLKDENAVIDAVCWRGTAGKLKFAPEDGLEVTATGRITTYPGRSSYQIVVEAMEPAGAGALMALLEKRKAALAAEGLFEASRKRPLPFLPEVIGIVTSPTGAVIRDILHRLAERFPRRVLVWPVAVQGEGAAEQIAWAIQGFNSIAPESALPRPDLLIVARGGGSIEDLWAFNEEIVVRAAANSAIPLISAVGHETDTTLIDFAADRRAPTPTAAAEMAVPVRTELQLGLAQMDVRMHGAMQRRITQEKERVAGLARGLPRPRSLLDAATQRLDDWSERLHTALPGLTAMKTEKLRTLSAAFRPQLLMREVMREQALLGTLDERLMRAMNRVFSDKNQKLESISTLLSALDYRAPLARGYALVKTPSGALVRNSADARAQSALTLVFTDGELEVSPA